MLSPNSWLDTILSVLEWGRCILQVEGMWTIMTRGKDSSLQALTVSLPTVCICPCDMILLFFPSVSIYLLLEYSLYIAPYNLLCPSEYGGITEYAFEFVSTGLAASIHTDCYLVNEPKIFSLIWDIQRQARLWRDGERDPAISAITATPTRHMTEQASLQQTANAWMGPADIMWCRRTFHMSSAKGQWA